MFDRRYAYLIDIDSFKSPLNTECNLGLHYAHTFSEHAKSSNHSMSASIVQYVSRRLTRNDATTSIIWGPCPPCHSLSHDWTPFLVSMHSFQSCRIGMGSSVDCYIRNQHADDGGSVCILFCHCLSALCTPCVDCFLLTSVTLLTEDTP
jgi:hypothetical protein